MHKRSIKSLLLISWPKCQTISLGTLTRSGSSTLLNEKIYKTTHDARRYMKPVKNVQYKHDFRALKEKPNYTAEPLRLPMLGGCNPETGFKHNQRVKQGVPFDYYWITAYPIRPAEGEFYEEKVLEIRCDANRSAHIAQLAGSEGRRWCIAAHDWKAGDVIRITNEIPRIPFAPKLKESWPVGAMAVGTQICMLEVIQNARDFSEMRAVIAGTSCTIVAHRENRVLIKLSGQREILVDKRCFATVGQVSNPEWGSQHWGSMNMKRRMGIKQGSGLWHRKDGYCGRKCHPPPPPMVPERRPDPPPRYRFSLTSADLNCGMGTNEFNPVLSGVAEW